MNEAPHNDEYVAFISYRHAKLDMRVAKTIQKRIESYTIPKDRRVNPKVKKLGKVFRDEDELPLSSNLSDSIVYGLDHSKNLIVICSPDLPKSQWCAAEIEHFIRARGRNNMIAVLAKGTPAESFSPYMLHPISGEQTRESSFEPLAADMTTNGFFASRLKFRKEMVRIYALLLGCGFDELWQRERRRFFTRLAAVLAAALLVLTVFTSVVMSKNIQISKQNDQIAEQNVQIVAKNKEIESALVKSYVNTAIQEADAGNCETALAYYASALRIDPNDRLARTGALIELQRQGWIVYSGDGSPSIDEAIDGPNDYEAEYVLDGSYLFVDIKDGLTYKLFATTIESLWLPDAISYFDNDDSLEDAYYIAYAIHDAIPYFMVWHQGYLSLYQADKEDLDDGEETVYCKRTEMIDIAGLLYNNDEDMYFDGSNYVNMLSASESGMFAMFEDGGIVIVDYLAGEVTTFFEYNWNFTSLEFDPTGTHFKILRYSSSDWGDTGLISEFYDIEGNKLGETDKNVRYSIVGNAYNADGTAALWADTRSIRLINGFDGTYCTPEMWTLSNLSSVQFTDEDRILSVDENGLASEFSVVEFSVDASVIDGLEAVSDEMPAQVSDDGQSLELVGPNGIVYDSISASGLGLESFRPRSTDVNNGLFYDEQNKTVYVRGVGKDQTKRNDHIFALSLNKDETEIEKIDELAYDTEREILTCCSYPGGFAFAATGCTVYVYRSGDVDPWRTINPKHERYINHICVSQLGYLVVDEMATSPVNDIVELWDLETATFIADLENPDFKPTGINGMAFDESGSVLTYERRALPFDYYLRTNDDVELISWVLKAPKLNDDTVAMISSLSSQCLSGDSTLLVQVPTFTGRLGNWDSVLDWSYR